MIDNYIVCDYCGGVGWTEGVEAIMGEDGMPEPSPCQIQCPQCGGCGYVGKVDKNDR